jgi:hypothetical protein
MACKTDTTVARTIGIDTGKNTLHMIGLMEGRNPRPALTSFKVAKTIITGHLHSAKIVPYSDYSGTRYGIDHGCLADPKSRAFTNYTESNPLNWRSGFCVLTFHKGRLLLPELVTVFDEKAGLVQWRGELLKV